jgi:hypothetical protein
VTIPWHRTNNHPTDRIQGNHAAGRRRHPALPATRRAGRGSQRAIWDADPFFDGDAAHCWNCRKSVTHRKPTGAWCKQVFKAHGLNVIWRAWRQRGTPPQRRGSRLAGLCCRSERSPQVLAAEEVASPPPPASEAPVAAPPPRVRTGPPRFANDFRRPAIALRPTGLCTRRRSGRCWPSVNAGAEVIADGSIHIYAPLRGRALAGASGRRGARILCTSFAAELVSVAGLYRTFDAGLPAGTGGQGGPRQADRESRAMNPERLIVEVLQKQLATPAALVLVRKPAPQFNSKTHSAGRIAPFTSGGTSVTRIVVVTSGKGGVGKTTTSASFASGLALRGYKTAVIDFDVGLRNLDLIMGCERRVVYDLVNVLNGEATLTPGADQGQTLRQRQSLRPARFADPRQGCADRRRVWKKFSRNLNTWASTTSSAIHRPASSVARSWP